MSKAQFIVLSIALTVFVSGCTDIDRIEELQSRIDALESGTKVVEAQEFRLVDAAGNIRGLFDLRRPDGEPCLYFFDAAGKQRLLLGLLEDGYPCLFLRDAAGQERITVASSVDGTSMVGFWDVAGESRASFGVQHDGSPTLVLLDATGKARIGLVIAKDGDPGVLLLDAAGDVIWQAP